MAGTKANNIKVAILRQAPQKYLQCSNGILYPDSIHWSTPVENKDEFSSARVQVHLKLWILDSFLHRITHWGIEQFRQKSKDGTGSIVLVEDGDRRLRKVLEGVVKGEIFIGLVGFIELNSCPSIALADLGL